MLAFNNKQHTPQIDAIQQSKTDVTIKDCKYCGKDHKKGQCPAYASQCQNCKKTGHWKAKCRSKPGQHHKKHQRKKLHAINTDTLSFDAVSGGKHGDDLVVEVEVKIPGREKTPAELVAKIDTGAQGNILPLRVLRRMRPDIVEKNNNVKYGDVVQPQTQIELSAYNGNSIPQLGSIRLPI